MEENRHENAMLVTKYLRPDCGGVLRRDDARNLMRRALELHVANDNLTLLAWAFLPSKVTLLVQLPTPLPLGDTLAELFGYYTRRFNVRYQRRGALFRTKFVKKVCTGPAEIERAIRRMHVAVDTMSHRPRPGEEPWSSASVYRNGTRDAITSRFDAKPTAQIARFG